MTYGAIPLMDVERQSGPTEKPVVPLVTHQASMLDGITPPPREWHIEGLIPARNVTLLFGDGGTGKSLLALQLAVATATGGYWVGREARLGTVLFISAEDDEDELHRRLIDICNAADVSVSDLHRLHYRSLVGSDTVLADLEKGRNILRATPLFKELEAAVRSIKPDLIVLDTLANLFAGDENQRSQAQQFIGLIRQLCSDHGATVVVLAHPSLGGMARGDGTSGSTAWNNSVRNRLYFKRLKNDAGAEDDPESRVLRVEKANYGPVGEEIRLRWQAGVFTSPTSPDSLTVSAEQARVDREFVELLAALDAEGKSVGSTESSTAAWVVFAKDHRAEGISKTGFRASMQRLLATGVIKSEKCRINGKDRSRLVPA